MKRVFRGLVVLILPVVLGACAGGTAPAGNRASVDELLDRAEAAYERGDHEESIRAINAIMARYDGADSGWAALHTLRAVNLIALEQFSRALADADRAVELAPENSENHRIRAKVNHGLERYRAAVADYTNALRLSPDPEIYMQRATSLALMNRFDAAIEDMGRFLTAKPESADGWYRLGLIYALQEDTQEALAAFALAIKHDPGSQRAHQAMIGLGCPYEDYAARLCG